MTYNVVKLGEICDFEGGSQPPKSNFIFEKKEGYIRFIQIRDFNSDKNLTYIPIAKKNRICKEDDILIGRYGASVGKILTGLSGAYNVALMKTVPNQAVLNKKFLFYYLSSNLFQEPLRQVSERSAQNGFSKEDIYNFSIVLPSLTEQKRIATKLDSTLTEIDKAIKLSERSLIISQQLFSAAVYRKLNSLGIDSNKKFENLCFFVRGPFGGDLKKSIFVKTGYAVYEQQHPINNQFKDFRYFITKEKFKEMSRFVVKPNDLLMSCSGVTLGKVGIVPEGAPEGIINQALLKITPNKNLLPKYLQLLIRSKIFQDLIWKISGGAAQPNVPSIKVIKNLSLPFPKLSEQIEVVKWSEKIENLIINIKNNNKIKKLKDLKSVVLLKELQLFQQ